LLSGLTGFLRKTSAGSGNLSGVGESVIIVSEDNSGSVSAVRSPGFCLVLKKAGRQLLKLGANLLNV